MAKTKKQSTPETVSIPIEKLELNRGQYYGLPKNPRLIRDARFDALKKSITDDPEMLNLREIIVYPLKNGNYLVIGGNMRLRACTELGFEELPCKVIPAETPVAKLRAYVVKDNVGFGENDWDAFANDWDMEELRDFGMDDGFLGSDHNIDEFFNEEEQREVDSEKDGIITVEIPAQYSLDVLRDKIKAGISEFPGCKVK